MTDFFQARNYTKANRSELRLIVIHTMESPEKPSTARAVAQWFASQNAPQASAHACVDNTEVVLCVKEQDIAWGAPGANRDGYHIEHAGYAAQTAADWNDEYSRAMLELSARHAADIATRYELPIVHLSVADVAAGKAKGLCGHVDVTNAFHKSTHTDPGGAFPWDNYLAMVAEFMRERADTEPPEAPGTDPAPAPEDVEGHPA